MKDKDDISVLDEILDFCENEKGISYYELKAISYEQDKNDWIRELRDRDSRRVISICLKEQRRKSGGPYRLDMKQAVERLSAAEDEWRKRNPQWFLGEYASDGK